MALAPLMPPPRPCRPLKQTFPRLPPSPPRGAWKSPGSTWGRRQEIPRPPRSRCTSSRTTAPPRIVGAEAGVFTPEPPSSAACPDPRMLELWGQLLPGAGLSFSHAGGGRETLSGTGSGRDSLAPGPTGQKSPKRVERRPGWRLVEHPPPPPPGRGAFPGMQGPEQLTLPPPSLLGGTRGGTRPWYLRGGKGPVVYLKPVLRSSPLPGAAF